LTKIIIRFYSIFIINHSACEGKTTPEKSWFNDWHWETSCRDSRRNVHGQCNTERHCTLAKCKDWV